MPRVGRPAPGTAAGRIPTLPDGIATSGPPLKELPAQRVGLGRRERRQRALRDRTGLELGDLILVRRLILHLIQDADRNLLAPLVRLVPRRRPIGRIVAGLVELVDALAVEVVRIDLVVD